MNALIWEAFTQKVQTVQPIEVQIPHCLASENGIPDRYTSAGGEVLVILGMDQYKHFPRYMADHDGLVIS